MEILYSCGLRVTELCELGVNQSYLEPTIADDEIILYKNEDGKSIELRAREAKFWIKAILRIKNIKKNLKFGLDYLL